jgi:HlyD family secretion protein
VLQIPTSAIAQGNKVLVVVAGRLEERQVETGLSNWRSTEIVDGLAEGELVVSSRESAAVRAGVEVSCREAT